MSIPEILLLIVAIALLVASFLVVDKDIESKGSEYKPPELTTDEIEKLKLQMKEVIDNAVSNGIIEAEDKMSKISNEKIMAVNDYSAQLLDKIEQNNKEVVFLYDMLCQKDDEIKVMFQKMETIRRDNKEFLEKLTSLMANKSKQKEVAGKQESFINTSNTSTNKINEEKSHDVFSGQKEEANDQKSDSSKNMNILKKENADEKTEHDIDAIATSEEDMSNPKEKILSLHKLNMSVLEISKQLGIGQGEVKLVIDLYSKKN